jgi:hypothetical protein
MPHLYEDIERAFEGVLDRGEPGVDFKDFRRSDLTQAEFVSVRWAVACARRAHNGSWLARISR